MKSLKIQGIVLESKNFFERDKLLIIFSPQVGKCKLLAKNAVSTKNQFLGRLEVPNYLDFLIYKGKSFFQITQCEILETFPNIRKEYNKISILGYFFDIILKSTSFEQNNQELFNLLLMTLRKLQVNNEIDKIVNSFHYNFLKFEGLLENEGKIVSKSEFNSLFENYCQNQIRYPELINL